MNPSVLLSLAILITVATPVSAQNAWDKLARAATAIRAPDCFILVSSPPTLKFGWYGEDPLAEADLREFRRVTLEGEPAELLKQVEGGPGWALFNPKGERVDDGSGVPAPARIRASMEKAGWKPLRETLQEHLRTHSGDGQARVELAFHLARQGREGKYAGTLSKAWLERLREDLLPTLRALADTPDLEQGLAESQPQPFGPTVAALRVAELDNDPEIGDAVKRLFAVVPPLLARDPENQILWRVRDFARREGDGTEDGPAFLASMEGVPNQPWPPFFLVDTIRRWYRKDPIQLTEVSNSLVARNLQPNLVSRLGRPQVVLTLQTWGWLHLEGLLRQRQFDEAQAYVGWMRLQAGRGWPEVSAALSKALRLVDSEDGGGPKRDEAIDIPLNALQKEAIKTALARAPLPDSPLLPIEPLRLALVNGELQKGQWEDLQWNSAFAPWDATELNWIPLRPKEVEGLKEHYGWSSEARWVLMQGDQVLASQAGMPNVQTLESALWGQGPPRLEILGTWIKAHPDRLDARRARVDLIRPRLPNPTLEHMFLADLEVLEVGPGPLSFRPDPDLWGPVARRIVFRLTERISHWPFHEGTWKAYIDWTKLMDTLPRPATVLADLETFPRQLGVRLPGPLPVPLNLAVVKTLENQNRFQEVDAWMQILWERGLKSWLIRWADLPRLTDKDPGGWLEWAAPEVQKLLAVWGNALRKMGRTKALSSLRWELESVKAGLGALLGRDGP